MKFTGIERTAYTLAKAPIGGGGEGDIYPVLGSGGKVAKIYKSNAMTKELEEKLRVMISHPPNSSVLSQVAWPLDMLYSEGICRGFVMPKLSINAELGDVYTYPPSLPISIEQKINIAKNICVVISEVHRAGYVFGDFNPCNIGLDTDTGLVSFLDTDTYHVVNPVNGKTYRCSVCAPGYAAPELLEKCSDYAAANPSASKDVYAKTDLPTFTKETDNFALAIHIFKLLMNGYTPFGGIIETVSVSQSSPGVGDAAVRRDSYCFKPGYKHQSAAILPLEALPQEIADFFTRAFIIGRHNPKQRPSAEEWHGALTRYEQTLVDCRVNPLHQYDKKNRACPLCAADRRYQEAVYGEPSRKEHEEPPGRGTLIQTPYRASAKRSSKAWIPAACIVFLVLAIGTHFLLPDGLFGIFRADTESPASSETSAENTENSENSHEPAQNDRDVNDVISVPELHEIARFGNHDWRVLEVREDRLLLLANSNVTFFANESGWCHSPNWGDSEIRRWLNNEFYYSFSDEERRRIIESTVHFRQTAFTAATIQDKIFLLSGEEIEAYFGNYAYFGNEPDFTPGECLASLDNGDAEWWWLRSGGAGSGEIGIVTRYGYTTVWSGEGGHGERYCMSDGRSTGITGGVRPALWLSLSDIPYETVIFRIYFDVTGANPSGLYSDFGYHEMTVTGEDWLEQALALMNQHTPFDLGGIWYDGARIYADLISDFSNGATWQSLQGTTGSWVNINILLLSLASFPGVDEIVILMNSERNMSGDHFSFEGVFIVINNNAAEVRERIQQNTGADGPADSAAWRQATEDFLSQFWSIFSIRRYWEQGSGGYAQLVSYRWDHNDFSFMAFDRQGGLIPVHSVPFLLGTADGFWDSAPFMAVSFALYDFNDDGIPEIIINFEGMSGEAPIGFVERIYAYADGQFVHVSERRRLGFANTFFSDEHGRAVRVTIYAGQDGDIFAVSILSLDGGLQIAPLYDRSNVLWHVQTAAELNITPDWLLGTMRNNVDVLLYYNGRIAHHSIGGIISNWFDFANPTVPGRPNEPLVEMPRLTSLEESMTESITQRLTG